MRKGRLPCGAGWIWRYLHDIGHFEQSTGLGVGVGGEAGGGIHVTYKAGRFEGSLEVFQRFGGLFWSVKF